jgi:molecular chaperone HscB
MNLSSNDFELFDVPLRFEQDRAQIDARWKSLQTAVHPDRFVSEGASAQRLAMQWAARVNEAYQRLKDPVRRAAQLCALHGVPVDEQRNDAMPTAFLVQQMQWREALEEAADEASVQALAEEVRAARLASLGELQGLIDTRKDWHAAAAKVRALMFVERFAQDVQRRLDALDD